MNFFFPRLFIILFGFLLVSCFSSLVSFPALAAEMRLEPSSQIVAPGKTFEVDVTLDGQVESINALQGTVIFPADALEIQDVRDGGTVVSQWIERPDGGKISGKIIFSGLIVGGYAGQSGHLFTIRFSGRKNGRAALDLADAKTLLNDGNGTETKVTLRGASVSVNAETTSTPALSNEADQTAPEPFTIALAKDPNIFDGRWFIAFGAEDKGSGIDHYEIRETRRKNNGAWKAAESPYLLADQERKSYVSVKAVDKKGNVRVAELAPVPSPFYPYAIGAGILLIILLFGYGLYRRRHSGRASAAL